MKKLKLIKKIDLSILKKLTIFNVLIILNILFLLECCIFYGSRLIHFYRIENPKIKENETIEKLIKLEKNIVELGDGLYKEEDRYIYKGKDVDNYVKYSGRIWRIVSLSKDGVKLVTDRPQTSLVWGINTNYDNSFARSWLNNDNSIKSFYETLNNKDVLTKTKTCTDVISEDSITCDNFTEDNVGMLSALEYQEAGSDNSYLNIGEYWWTSNINSNNEAWYVYSKGTLNNTVSSGRTYYTYGIRPTVTLKLSTPVLNGDGKASNPYNLDAGTSNFINAKYVGNYVKFNDYNWRIIEVDENYVKVVMDDVIKVDEKDYLTSYGKSNYMTINEGVGNYLNTTFYDSLENKEYILKHDHNMGRYDKTYNYDFNKITEYKENMYVGLLQLGELFVTDVDNYFLSTRTITSDGTIYQVLEDGKIYAGSTRDEKRLRPTLYLKSDITVSSGSGTKSDPYMIG